MANWKWLLLIAVLIVILDNHGCNAEPTAIVNGIWNLVSGIWTRVKTWLGWPAPIPATSKQFFLEGKEPAGLKGDTFIEQMYGAGPNPYFATVYSKAKRSPVYSAYRVLPVNSRTLGVCGRPNVQFQEFGGDPGHNNIYKANTGTNGVTHITRGHLNPSCINSYNADAMKSTFIYSNAVPQYENSNNVVWSNFEQKLVTYAKTCGSSGGTLYLLTGPADFDFDGTNKVAPPPAAPKVIQDASGNKLPVPPVLWTAGCCWKGPGVAAAGLGVIGTNKQAGSVTYERVGLNKLQTLLGGTPLFPGDVSGECGKAPAGPFG